MLASPADSENIVLLADSENILLPADLETIVLPDDSEKKMLPADLETIVLPDDSETIVLPSNSKRESEVQRTKTSPATDKQSPIRSKSSWLSPASSESDLIKEERRPRESVNLGTSKLFNLYDTDGSDTIGYKELKAALLLEADGECTDH